MNSELVQITLPLTQEGLLGAALLLVLFGVVALALFGDGSKSNDEPMVRALKAFAWVYGVVWLFVFLGTLQTLWFVFTGTGPEGHGEDMRSLGMGALIAALLGAPFVIWGTVLKHQTVMFQKEGHMTDRINKAVEQLGAVKDMEWIGRPVKLLKGKVTESTQFVSDSIEPNLKSNQRIKTWRRIVQEYWDEAADDVREIDGIEYIILTWPEEVTEIEVRGEGLILAESDLVSFAGEWTVFKKTEPNLEVRIGAILSLERIAQDSTRHDGGRDHVRIMEILNAYINENAKEEVRIKYPEDLNSSSAQSKSDNREFKAVLSFSFQSNRPQPRIDILTAIKAIGRRSPTQALREKNLFSLEFSDVNLQGLDLITYAGEEQGNIYLDRARFLGARLENINAPRARMKSVVFSNCKMCFANLNSVDLRDATIAHSDLRGAIFILTDLSGAEISSCIFSERSYLMGANLSGAFFRDCDLSAVFFEQAQLEASFGDESVLLGVNGLERPEHWPRWVLPNTGKNNFKSEWEKWKSDPYSYIPPPKPD